MKNKRKFASFLVQCLEMDLQINSIFKLGRKRETRGLLTLGKKNGVAT